MANSDTIQVSSLPLPPMQYVNQYTDEIIRRGRAPKPPPPIQDTYHMFGNAFNTEESIIRPLESQGIKRLYPLHFDRRRELKKLNQSLLANFLDLLDLLVNCPDSPRRAEKVEDLSLLFIHIHHLFQKHLDKVMDILQQAIQNLPEPMEIDSKLMIETDLLMSHEKSENAENNSDPCYILDRIMCNIVDNMQ
ncbi:hypothetical protein NQ314_020372 [Rhamnusium bicolor]|uniref:Mediator of RNA polymerase II transcription subunit 7 n=1 Tax=Rhamnusium bicolor TaxID=1586634 RepID=A0AAV8WK12_9CUCU|nr:hypothetical protein NQ314_020372 [Rhamnusium bicolor]